MTDENGFLTDVDKQFLRGEREYGSKQGRYQRRRAIRDRTRGAFRDFAFLFHTLERKEANKIFDPPEEEAEQVFDDMIKTVAFLYDNLRAPPGGASGQKERTVEETFRQVLYGGVSAAEHKRLSADETGSRFAPVVPDNWVDVDFEVTVKELPDVDPDRALEKLAQMEVDELTEPELREIVRRLVKSERYRLSDDLPTDHGVADLLARIEELAEEEGTPWAPDSQQE